jgi:hypothetical protein
VDVARPARSEAADEDRKPRTGGKVGIAVIAREIASLPPEAQKQVIEFMASLKTRQPRSSQAKKTRRTKLSSEPFVGMWRDRPDLQESTAWVRDLRQHEWAPETCTH